MVVGPPPPVRSAEIAGLNQQADLPSRTTRAEKPETCNLPGQSHFHAEHCCIALQAVLTPTSTTKPGRHPVLPAFLQETEGCCCNLSQKTKKKNALWILETKDERKSKFILSA